MCAESPEMHEIMGDSKLLKKLKQGSEQARKREGRFLDMKPVAIRGATTVKNNDAEEIKTACLEMMQKIVAENEIKADDIIMVFLTMTQDLTAYNAASAIRLGMQWSDVPFFTSQEPEIDGSLKKCVRALVQVHTDKSKSEIKHVYLGEAAKLRPDLSSS